MNFELAYIPSKSTYINREKETLLHEAFCYWYKPEILIRQTISCPKEFLAKQSCEFNPNTVGISLEFDNVRWQIFISLVWYES